MTNSWSVFPTDDNIWGREHEIDMVLTQRINKWVRVCVSGLSVFDDNNVVYHC